MIHINLLPVRSVQKQSLGRQQIVLFVVLVIGAMVGNYLWYSNVNTAAISLATRVSRAQKELADLDHIIGEVKNYTKDKQALEDKLRVLDTLRKGRSGPVKMLDAMATAIPKNVWLRGWEDKNGLMSVEGSAVSNEDLAEFMKGLTSVVWTPEGMGRLIERRGGTTSRVELGVSGQIKDLAQENVGMFFKEIKLKKSTLRSTTGSAGIKVVDFSLTFKANYAI